MLADKNNLQKVVDSFSDEQCFDLLIELEQEKDNLPLVSKRLFDLLDARAKTWSKEKRANVVQSTKAMFFDEVWI